MSKMPLEQLLRLPEDTRQQVSHYFEFNQPDKKHKGWWIARIKKELENPALFLYKLIPSPEEDPMKASFLEAFAKSASQAQTIKKILTAQEKRLQALTQTLCAQRYQVDGTLKRRVAWRLIMGLGMAHAYETGLLLHGLYGFPLIPGSALKGLTRSYAFDQIALSLKLGRLSLKEYQGRKSKKPPEKTPLEKLEDFLTATEKDQLYYWEQLQKDSKIKEWDSPVANKRPEELGKTFDSMKLFREIFGMTAQQGHVIFLDALPIQNFTLERDIMNPHYGEYYKEGSKTPPADWLSPNPIFFLTVGNKTHFRFYLASRDQKLLDQAKRWLEQAVEEFGIGAKTRAGYGELQAEEAGAAAKTGAASAPATADPTAGLESAIESWTARDMGGLELLIQRLSALPNAERRLQLARKLQERLRKERRKMEAQLSIKPMVSRA